MSLQSYANRFVFGFSIVESLLPGSVGSKGRRVTKHRLPGQTRLGSQVIRVKQAIPAVSAKAE